MKYLKKFESFFGYDDQYTAQPFDYEAELDVVAGVVDGKLVNSEGISDDLFRLIENNPNIQYEIYSENGPAGGWPVVMFRTTDLITMCQILQYWDAEDRTPEQLAEVLQDWDGKDEDMIVGEIL